MGKEVDYELGNIQVKAKLQDQEAEEIHNPAAVTQKYQFLREKPKEHFYAVFLKSDNQVIGDKLISLGTTSNTTVDVKDIVRTASLVNASAVILIHNHPSDNTQPTETDRETTQKIQQTLELLDIQVLDHIIISQNNSYSMKQKGDI